MTKEPDLKKSLDDTISRMQEINRKIAAQGQPPSSRELDELKSLGREYARLVDDLASSQG